MPGSAREVKRGVGDDGLTTAFTRRSIAFDLREKAAGLFT